MLKQLNFIVNTMRIRTKLFVMIVGLATISLVPGGMFFLNNTIENLGEEMITAHQQQANVIAGIIKDKFENERRILEQVANADTVRTLNPSVGDKYLAGIVQSSSLDKLPVYSHILVTDAKGDEMMHSMSTHSVPPTSLKGRDYFEGAKGGNSLLCMPNISKSTGRKVFPIAVPVFDGGQYKGTLAGFLTMEYVSEILSKNKIGANGYIFMIGKGADGKEGRIIASPIKEDLWDRILLQDKNEQLKNIAVKMQEGKKENLEFVADGRSYRASIVPVGIYDWSIAVVTPTDELFNQSRLNNLRLLYYGVTLFAILLLGIFSLYAAKKFVQPIIFLTSEIRILSEKGGDLTREIKVASQDEIGELARYLNQFLGNIRVIVRQVAESSEQVTNSSEQLLTSAEQSAQASVQVAQSIIEVANGSEKQVASVALASNVVEGITADTQLVADNANRVSVTAKEAALAAKTGNIAINNTVNQMALIEKTVTHSAGVVSMLGSRSQEIGQIVSTISGIAGQTNLLALNAAIEAARAGEQGRGFSVVAEEVRKLAEQSQEAAKKITILVAEIQNQTGSAVSAMDNGTREVQIGMEVAQSAGKAFRQIADLVAQVSAQIEEISQSMHNMAGSNQQIVNSISDIGRVSRETSAHTQTVSAITQEQTASVEEIAAASHSLHQLAQELKNVITKFKV